MFARSTMASMRPCLSANSAVWKPLGSSCLMVSRMTRWPAKPSSALGSAMMMSPSVANDAVTPPVVGSVMTDTYSSPALSWRSMAQDVFAICMRETSPSCMRAPPEAQKTTTGSFRSVARSNRRAIFSPTTEPMDAMRKCESMMPMATGRVAMVPKPVHTASESPVFSRSVASFSG